MTKPTSTKEWERYFEDRGIADEYIPLYLAYIKQLNQNKVPIIFEFEHLASLLGIKRSTLAKIVNSSSSFYRSFTIPKRKGGKRKITAPYPSLLHCQRWIYKNILIHQPIHNAAHGFTPKRSIISNARIHLSSKCLLKMDLKDFFPSIPINWVVNYFQQLGYANNVSFYLASICSYREALGQGAPTSPYLTNILLKVYDDRLHKLSLKYHLKYSRYADDLAFSGNYIPHKFIEIVDAITNDYGLRVNKEKTVLHTKPGKRIVTGLSVSGTELKLPRNTKREIKKDLHYINKFGYLSHISNRKISNPFYLDSLRGKLAFWRQVEPENPYIQQGLTIVINALEEIQ